MSSPSQDELTAAIADATRQAVFALFREHPGRYYYCSLVTTGEAHPPYLSAWSHEALDKAAQNDPDPPSARMLLEWSATDSPFCCYGDGFFEPVRALFAKRPRIDPMLRDDQWDAEWRFRVDAMSAALAQLDKDGIFGRGEARTRIVVNVEVLPPDRTNTDRAVRLNPTEAIKESLAEAAEG
jgi:hypothetical protein